MFPRIRGVRHVRDYELEMTFSDGTVAASISVVASSPAAASSRRWRISTSSSKSP